MQHPTLPACLPQPDEDSLAHSALVAAYLRERIAAAGGISFGEYMHHALYSPGLGYYVSGRPKFSAAGDFVTAPEVSPLFGRVVAAQLAPVLAAIDSASILELGAGSGALAVAVLEKLHELDVLPERYLVLEVSAELADRQRQRLSAELPELASRVEWVDHPPAGFRGVMIANEVADALPVERFRVTAAGIEQAYVVSAAGDGFAWEWRPASRAIREAVETARLELPAGYCSELSLGLQPWVGDLVDALHQGLLLLVDYGLPRREYYARDRSNGWLRCHFRHHAHDDPLVLPGIQDITAWVDFTSVAEAGSRHGAGVAGFVTQAMFLLAGGLDNEFRAMADASPRLQAELTGAIKRLTLPDEMGENFKCMGLGKGDIPRLCGFRTADRSHRL